MIAWNIQVENLYYLQDIWTERNRRLSQAVCYRDSCETKLLDLKERRGKDLQISYLLPCPVGSQGVPTRIGGLDKAMDVGKQVWK